LKPYILYKYIFFQPEVVPRWRTTHSSFVAIPKRELQPVL